MSENTEKFNPQERKSILYSQNFLKDPELVTHLLDKTSLNLEDLVYEIGAGRGIITEKLSERTSKVIAFEKDEELYSKLEEKFKNHKNVEIIQGDFLEKDINFKKSKVFSNIPFNITADIIKKLTKTENSPIDTYLFMQKEAVKKYSGQPKETLASLLNKPWFELKSIHNFYPEDFTPIPSVDVVLLQMKKREKALVEKKYTQAYKDFIAYSFNQWQPDIKRTYKKAFSHKQIERLSKDLNFKTNNKITELSFEQFLGLFNYFLKGVDDEKKKIISGYEKRTKDQQKQLTKIHRTRTDKEWKKK